MDRTRLVCFPHATNLPSISINSLLTYEYTLLDETTRKKEEEKRRQLEKENEPPPPMSQEEIDALNRQFGYPEPPATVCAIGNPDQAAVWWIMGEEVDPLCDEPAAGESIFIPEGEDPEEFNVVWDKLWK